MPVVVISLSRRTIPMCKVFGSRRIYVSTLKPTYVQSLSPLNHKLDRSKTRSWPAVKERARFDAAGPREGKELKRLRFGI